MQSNVKWSRYKIKQLWDRSNFYRKQFVSKYIA